MPGIGWRHLAPTPLPMYRSITCGALGKLWAPVPWMLEAAILLQIFLGDYVEAGVVALLLVANAAIGFFQEGRARATLDALKSRLAPLAAGQRGGGWEKIPS